MATSDDCYELLKEALKKVDRTYYRFETADKNECFIFRMRERVFCYELYHQLRYLQAENPELYEFDINGEPDKGGRALFTIRCDPDFIFHRRGYMDNNLMVLEVKCKLNGVCSNKTGNPTGFYKDFRNLCMLVSEDIKYNSGVFLLFGVNKNQFNNKVKLLKAYLLSKGFTFDKNFAKIKVLLTEVKGAPIVEYNLKDLFESID